MPSTKDVNLYYGSMLHKVRRIGCFPVLSCISLRASLERRRGYMNTPLARGTSCRPVYRFLAVEPTADQLMLRDCYAAFCLGGDGFYRDWWDFARDVRTGHLVPFVIEHGHDFTHFGIELMKHPQDGGPVFSVSYYTGAIDGELLAELAFFLYNSMQDHKQQLRTGKRGYLRVVGRKGWARLIARIGVTMDKDGYIADDQPAVIHAQMKHLN